MELSGLKIFKYLPAAKKAQNSNCKKCGCPTCMAFALKLAKGGTSAEACPFMPEDLKKLIEHSNKIPQKTIEIEGLKTGGENVLFRHEKTFVNPSAICILLDCTDENFEENFKRAADFEINILNRTKKLDLIILKNSAGVNTGKLRAGARILTYEEFEKLPLEIIEDRDFNKTAQTLKFIREKAVKEKEENYSNPVCVKFSHSASPDFKDITARAAFYICKYANMLLFADIDEGMITSLMLLRENIFTDPRKPLKVEPKIYGFNGEDENALIFLTTNFALTFFAVASELEKLNRPSYLIVTPADGMSVLTAWSAEKFTAQMVAKTLKNYDLASKVKTRKIIIPGLLAHMKNELQSEIKNAGLDFEIVTGTIDACDIAEFVKGLGY